MQRNAPHAEQRGFVTVAQNSPTGDYLAMAYVQALSIKAHMPNARYAVIVDAPTANLVTEQHRRVFDYVIEMTVDTAVASDWKLSNDWQIFSLTPFKETIKLEADVLITRDISHWWKVSLLREVVLGLHCRDYENQVHSVSPYRAMFANNNLPDVYSGIMYFRYSRTATAFFTLARDIFADWQQVRAQLLKPDVAPTTDVVYALAARIIGVEKVTLPVDFFNFVHMKPGINGWLDTTEYVNELTIVADGARLLVNNLLITHPFHYHAKNFITPELTETYERIAGISSSI